ncbi:hypothetical protein NARC_130023 [Candidatus Nitrosocosmicus arcticus]|uniref:Uncharacterized protein n=1 Tax=Candidatus Nitrosocosmicus arcticus TaxID=2035267 RepID=A0A557SSW3_9ARCH|nr:hypothetical protein [Candidatus Nitrosocosmicus arcticus]TVP39684.1 hypothetical protein NARC_130023 [Candidatus Nitrosocosmicus arcticus]
MSTLKENEKEIEGLTQQKIDEITNIYSEKGFENELLKDVVNVITSKERIG